MDVPTPSGLGRGFFTGGSVRAIRSYKNYLFALGVDGFPYTVYWSDLGSVEDLPTSSGLRQHHVASRFQPATDG